MAIKRIITIALAVVLVLSLASCKSRDEKVREEAEKPKGARENVVVEEVVPSEESRAQAAAAEVSSAADGGSDEIEIQEFTKAMLSAIRSGDRSQIQKYVDYNTIFSLKEDQNADWILQQVLMRVKSEVVSTEIGADSAVVNLKLTNTDMSAVLPEFFSKAMTLEFENALAKTPQSAGELEQKYREIFVALMAQNESNKITSDFLLKLVKNETGWSVDTTSAFGDAILGGYVKAQESAMAQAQTELQALMEQQQEAAASKALEEENKAKMDNDTD